jgi:ATP phosphoribosyltransferase regulatory subunit
MSQYDRWLLPEGIQDVLPHEARRLEDLRREFLDLFGLWGYELVMPPFVEYLDSLLVGTGHDLDLQTFKLTDQLSGRTLGVRADMTPQVARIDAHDLQRDEPTRLCYLGTVLHALNDPLERSRSPLQIGAELYGHAGIESDLEIVQLMLETLALAGAQSVCVDFGHVGIFRGLVQQAGFDETRESMIFDVLQRKANTELDELLEGWKVNSAVREMLVALPRLNGNENVIERSREVLAGAGPEVLQSVDYLEDMSHQMRTLFPGLSMNFDLGELRGYHYQTGVVFAAFVPGYGREVARGGRYDEIGKVFGRARPATGFSADVKVLASLNQEAGDAMDDGIFAPAGADIALEEKIRDLRVSGKRVVRELPGQFGGAEEMKCGYRLAKEKNAWVVVPA